MPLNPTRRALAFGLSLLAAGCAPESVTIAPTDALTATPTAVSSDETAVVAAARRKHPMPCRPYSDTVDWEWSKLGLVTGLDDAAAPGEGVLAPAAAEKDGVLHVWFTRKVGLDHKIFHAVSLDHGASLTEVQPVSGLKDGLVVAFPSVRRVGDGFLLAYGSGSIDLASSADGVHFTVLKQPALSATFEATFDQFSVLYPSLAPPLEDGGPQALFYAGFDGQRVRIGRATEQADGSFLADSPTPVIELGGEQDFDNTAVAQPNVSVLGREYLMWYGGYDTSKTNPGPYRIGLAASTDGFSWSKRGVAIPLGADGADAYSTRDPAALPFKGKWLMFYVGMGTDGRYRLLRATSDVCSVAP